MHITENLSRKEERDYKNNLWNAPDSIWKELYSNNKERFLSMIDNEIRKLEHPEAFDDIEKPSVLYEKKTLEDIRLNEWPEPERSRMKDLVFQKFGIPKGKRKGLEIDHIDSMKDGGKTVLENLQVLTRRENRIKG